MTMQQPSENQLQLVANMLFRRRALILAMGLLGALLAGLAGLLIPEKYTAKAQILIDPQQVSAVSESMGRALPVNELTIETQVAMLASRNHLRHVRESLLLEPELRAVAAWGRQEAPIGSATAGEADHGDADDWGVPTIEELEKGLTAFQERQSRVVAVTFTWTSPEQAAVIANQLARLHVATLLDLRKAEKGSASFEQELAHLERQLSLARSELSGRQSQLTTLHALRQRPGDRDELIAAMNSSVLTELRQKEILLQSSQGKASAASADYSASAQDGVAGLKQLRRQIDREIELTMSELENETHIANAHVHSLQQRVEMIESARRRARSLEVRQPSPTLPATAADSDPFLSLLRRQQREMREQPEISPGVQILTVAEAPIGPSSPNPILFVLPAFVAFTIGGGLLATVLEGLDRRLRSARDVEEVLGMSCIGLVPQLRNTWDVERVYKFLHDKPFAPYTEAIRSVVTSALQLTEPPPHPKVFLITSSVPGEGKTMLALSFASFAVCLRRRVVLIDVAFRRKAIPDEVTGDRSSTERPDVFQGLPWRDMIRTIPNVAIDYLPLQTNSGDPAALLSGSRMSELLGELRDSYDCVVIHGDPILTATSSRLLVPLVDKVLLAVKWGHTRREVAQNALGLLDKPDVQARQLASIVKVVITNVALKRHAAYRHGDAAEVLARDATN